VMEDKDRLLIHRAIDGEISENERAELKRLLESSPEARRFQHQMEGLSTLPVLLHTVDAPSEIKENVLSTIDPSRYRARQSASGPRAIGALIGSLLTPRLIYGLAAGLLIGIALGALSFGDPMGRLDPLDLSGTVLSGKDSASLKRVDADSFTSDQAKGRLAVDVGRGLTYIQVELQSSQEVSVVLEFDPDSYILRAFEQQSPLPNNIVSSQGRLQASHIGSNRYMFVLGQIETSNAPVVCRVESSGVIYQREIQL